MNEPSGQLKEIDYKRVFPCVHLFRAFLIAADVRKIFLAIAAIVLLTGGHATLSRLAFVPQAARYDDARDWPGNQPTGFPPISQTASNLRKQPWTAVADVVSNWQVTIRPLDSLFADARVILDPQTGWDALAFSTLQLLWALLVWAVFGGAITRMAAVEFARDEKISIRAAVRFSAGKVLAYVAAPSLAVLTVVLFWSIGALIGLCGRIPGAGDIIVGAGFIVPLACGVVMALVLLALAAGWPLMNATISTEGTDAFDGFSRAFSYVFGRPWQYLFYVIVAVVFGSVVIYFFTLVLTLSVEFTRFSLAAGMGMDHAAGLTSGTPESISGPGSLIPSSAQHANSIGADLAGIWLNLASLAVWGFAHSYFWTVATIIYFLLRKSDDATELDEVYRSEAEEDDLLPLVGVAASDQPVVEQPAEKHGGVSKESASGPS